MQSRAPTIPHVKRDKAKEVRVNATNTPQRILRSQFPIFYGGIPTLRAWFQKESQARDRTKRLKQNSDAELRIVAQK